MILDPFYLGMLLYNGGSQVTVQGLSKGLKGIEPVVKECLFVCFVALRPMSTAMVIAGRSVHLTTLFPGQA